MGDRQLVERRASLAFAIVRLVAGVTGGMIIYIALNEFVPTFFSDPPVAVQSGELQETIGYADTLWTVLPFLILMIAALGLISRAAFESRGGV
jgi:zinc transporter ZupT